ncbi:MAG: phenylalanine--tRNA ligase subunit beta [Candidatus Lokiarchaeota archaeon]|nr:phenylalanine--tRNA ligase subunit beta [Candidatus Lokiarchaeota archaeon]
MPTLDFTIKQMSKLVGRELSIEELESDLQWIALDIEAIDEKDGVIKVEYQPNRPDYSSPEGIARALKGYYELEMGLAQFEVRENSDLICLVDNKVKKIRPYIVMCAIKDIHMDEEQVATLMNIQEALHHALGRGRQKVAIGVHDFDKVNPPYQYTTVKPNAIKFRPLQMEKLELTPQEILEEHPKGIEYAHIVNQFEEYPIIFDRDNNVISFPPIINGILTTVTDKTRNILLDLTGTDLRLVTYSMNILVTTFADMGGKIESAKVVSFDGTEKCYPDLTPEKWTIKKSYINSYIGLELTSEEMIHCLKKCRMDAFPGKKKGTLEVFVPAYRSDFIHEVDFTEEVATGYNYKQIEPVLYEGGSIGSYHPIFKLQDKVKQIMVGAGYLETFNFMLTARETYKTLKIPFDEKHNVIIDNPVSKEYNTTRTMLMPVLMRLLQFNRSEEKPIKIFEVGDVIIFDASSETGATQKLHVCALTHHSSAEFTEIRSLLDFLTQTLGIWNDLEVKPSDNPTFISGRTGEIWIKNSRVGIIGEIHPEVLENFGLRFPVAIFELDLSLVLPEKDQQLE